VGAAVVVAGSLILSRLYSPEAFGTLAVFVSLVSTLTTVGSWRYELAIPLPEQKTVAANLLALCLAIVVVMGAAVSMAVFLFAEPVLKWLNSAELAPYVWLVPVAFVGGSAYQTLGAWTLRHEAFEEIARTRVGQSCGTVGTQLALGVAGLGPVGLLAGDTLGRIAGVGALARFTRRSLELHSVTPAGMFAAFRRYVKFPLLSSPASLLTSLSTHVPVLLIVQFFGPAVGGLFLLTTRVLGIPSALLGQAVGQVFLARAARVQTDESQLCRLTQRTAMGMFAVGVVLLGVVALGGPGLFSAAFGERWAEAGLYARILAPWYLLWLVCNPLSYLLSVREWQSTTLIVSALECAVKIGAILVGAMSGSQLGAISLLGAASFLLALVTVNRFFRAGYTTLNCVLRRIVVPLSGAILSLGVLLCLLRAATFVQTAIRIGSFLLICALLEWRFRWLREAVSLTDRPV
jgi:O-antigen/teichoic acid export membrane protein